MSELSETRVPREIDDPALRDALLSEYAYAERLRSAIIGWTAVAVSVLLGLLTAAASLGVALPAPPTRTAASVAVVTGLLLVGVQFAIGAGVTRLGDHRARATLWYGTTALEVGLIVAAWATVAALNDGVRTFFPGLIGYTALVVLSALRLDWRLTAFTAVLGAAGYALLNWHLGPGDAGSGYRPRAFEGTASVLVIGALSALVAERARRRTVHALRAIAESQRLQRAILDAEDAARAQIGRDLHDGLGGRLTGLALMAQGLARRADSGNEAPAAALRELADLAVEGVDEVRRLARGLDPAPVELGLAEALRRLAERTGLAGTPCTFDVEGDAATVDGPTTMQLYHIAHEATSNALRHGAASRVDVRLTVRPSTIALDIRDDGTGIPETPVPGLGLRTMAQRAALLGAVLRVRPGPAGGTLVSCVVPR
jgi:signal transduction histidine kinase